MEIAGYIAALLIGLSLGLIGGGGSILTIPVLVYLFHIQPTLATGYSLFIVGCSSLAGAYKNYRRGLINTKAAFYFGMFIYLHGVLSHFIYFTSCKQKTSESIILKIRHIGIAYRLTVLWFFTCSLNKAKHAIGVHTIFHHGIP